MLSILALASLTAAGCRSSNEVETVRDADGYEPQVALALATTPPIVRDRVDVDSLELALSREGRGEAAFVGYDSPSIVTYDLVVRDYQRMGTGGYGFGYGGFGHYGYGYVPFNGYSRQAVSTRSFTRVR